jgi:beta-lactamase superfamily II metal-dependent hydrolase
MARKAKFVEEAKTATPKSKKKKKTAMKAGKKKIAKKPPATTTPSVALDPPKGGAIVRMYRIGHGDCFLLAFGGDPEPVHVLIDCGYKPGSPAFLKSTPDDVVADIRAVTKNKIDVAVITHEHQDHVNAITQKRFAGLTVGEVWFAWTESREDKLARRLRKKYGDSLRALVAANRRLAASNPAQARRVSELIALELGGEMEATPASVSAGATAAGAMAADGGSFNKQSMRLLQGLSSKEPKCIYPHKEIIELPGAKSVRVFALGPPYDEDLLEDLEPHDGEGFPKHGLTGHSIAPSFAAAVNGKKGEGAGNPFSSRQTIRLDRRPKDVAKWFRSHYGTGKGKVLPNDDEVGSAAKFRRIDSDWLLSVEHLALAMGNDTNNASLVLAFELGRGGKVLLFAADAQRGNWASWATKPFKDGRDEVDVRELLGRTVLYKTGHHGSHNATLTGNETSKVPNLSWLGRGKYASEFTAMITAVRKWADGKAGWDHPLKAIKTALLERCGGRVLQTDTDLGKMAKHDEASDRSWAAFQDRVTGNHLYFDYRIDPN